MAGQVPLRVELEPFGQCHWKQWRSSLFERLQAKADKRERPPCWRHDQPLGVRALIPVHEKAYERDIDNLLKHVLDAAQGQVGQPKRLRFRSSPVGNDRQIICVVAEKVDAAVKPRGFVEIRQLGRRKAIATKRSRRPKQPTPCGRCGGSA